jgi:hypothetical protein
MADNVAITAGSGTNIATDDDATAHHQLVKVEWGANGTFNLVDPVTGKELPVQAVTRMGVPSASAMTRPSDTAAYAAGDLVANSTTAGSVAAITLTVSDVNDAPVCIERIRIVTGLTSPITGVSFRIHLYQSNPTSSSGVVGGDNTAFNVKLGTIIGTMVGTFKTYNDGSVAFCVPEDGARIITIPTSGAKTVFALLQTINIFTPASGSTFTLTAEVLQGRA